MDPGKVIFRAHLYYGQKHFQKQEGESFSSLKKGFDVFIHGKPAKFICASNRLARFFLVKVEPILGLYDAITQSFVKGIRPFVPAWSIQIKLGSPWENLFYAFH